MAEVLFYENPVPLHAQQHRNVRIAANPAGFAFARHARSVLLAGIEFFEAAKEYPIVFARAANGKVVAVVLVGLQEENMFVDAAGKWNGRYVPAFVRRYPFVLAENAPGQPLTVCIDVNYPGLNGADGDLLFDAQGKPSARLAEVMRFLNDFQQQYARTEGFIGKLQEYDLLQERVVQAVAADGNQSALPGILVVDEQKLQELDDAKALDLYRSGYLGWIWAHLGSLTNLNRLIKREL